MKILAFIYFVLITLFVYPQQNDLFVIHGKVVDSITNEPIANVSIEVIGQSKNNIISSEKGLFLIKSNSLTPKASFSHISYNTQKSFIKKNNIIIKLSPKTNMLKSAEVKVNKPKKLLTNIPYQITDYEFNDSNIVFIAHKDKLTKKAYLCELNQNGDTIYSSKIPKSEGLFVDYKGDNFLITNSEAWKLPEDIFYLDVNNFITIDDFSLYVKPIILEKNNNLFYKKYYYNNQLLQYYYYYKYSKEFKEFVEIVDWQKLSMLKDRSRIIANSDDPEIQQRFEDMAFYKPVYAPILTINDTLCIFNFTDSYIEFYSDSLTLVKKIPVNFHKEKHLKQQILKDEVTEKIYTLFVVNGISILKEIDICTGSTISSIKVPELPFIQDIKINNNSIYFLYTNQNIYTTYRSLYKMKI